MGTLKISLKGKNFQKNLAIIRSCKGRKWNMHTKQWFVPDTIDNLKVLLTIDNDDIKKKVQSLIEDREIDIERELLRAAVTPEGAFELKKDYPFLFDHQCIGAHYILKKERYLLADEVGCVSGDTIVSVNRGGITRKYTLETIYKRTHEMGRYMWDKTIPTQIRCLKNGRFGLNEMEDIIDKGVRNTIKIVTESGKILILTPDHEILTPNGYKESGKMVIGDEIVCNGTNVCKMCGSNKDIITYKYAKFNGYCKRCMYKTFRTNPNMHKDIYKYTRTDGYIYLRGEPLRNHPRKTTLTEHVYLMEQKIGRYLVCGEEVHHINGIKSDNRLENLMLVDRTTHKKLHHAEIRFGDFKHSSGSEVITVPKYEKIISMEPFGEQHVYDIVMKEPYRNFVANGIVVHNCGKTVQVMPYIDRMVKDGRKIVILCPSSISHQWASEIERFINLPSTNIVGLVKNKRLTEYGNGSSIIITTYESFKGDIIALKEQKFDFSKVCVIADEASKMKNRETQVYKQLRSISPELHGFISLSATPIENSLDNFFNIISITIPNFMTRVEFENTYCVFEGDKTKCSGYRNLKEFIHKIAQVMIRRTKEDVTDLIPPHVQNRIIPLTKEQRMCMEGVRKYLSDTGNMGCVILLREIANDTSLLNPSTSTVIQDMQKKGMLPSIIPHASNKLPECLNIIEEIGNEQIIIFTQFTQMAIKLGGALVKKGYKIKILTGDNSIPERNQEIQRFKKGEYQILIATDIFGYGANLQFCHYMINFDIPWNPAKLNQRIGRIHRIGSDETKTVINLLCEDIDEHVYDVICGKQNLFDQVVDGKAIDDDAVRKQILQKLI